MNKQRRQLITESLEKVFELISDIEVIRDDEQEAFDNIPESLQESERCQAMQEAINSLDEALEALEEAQNSLENIG